jgi:hypothetical protein
MHYNYNNARRKPKFLFKNLEVPRLASSEFKKHQTKCAKYLENNESHYLSEHIKID